MRRRPPASASDYGHDCRSCGLRRGHCRNRRRRRCRFAGSPDRRGEEGGQDVEFQRGEGKGSQSALWAAAPAACRHAPELRAVFQAGSVGITLTRAVSSLGKKACRWCRRRSPAPERGRSLHRADRNRMGVWSVWRMRHTSSPSASGMPTSGITRSGRVIADASMTRMPSRQRSRRGYAHRRRWDQGLHGNGLQ